MSLFPLLHMILMFLCLTYFFKSPSFSRAIALIFAVYFFAPLMFRIHNIFFPLKEGESQFDSAEYHPWWGTYQMQVVYIAFPVLEAGLRIIPGCYSRWLKLWGSQIGSHVYWTPKAEILDRTGLDIGNQVIFGHNVTTCSHHIRKTKQGMRHYYRCIRIGHSAFIGAASRITAGVVIDDGVRLHACNDVYPDVHVTKDHPRKEKQCITSSIPEKIQTEYK